jgi:hypothetical protein
MTAGRNRNSPIAEVGGDHERAHPKDRIAGCLL